VKPEDVSQFYEAALTAGSILSGFIGTFLNFRIQREANYYRQPVLNFRPDCKEGLGQDVPVGLSHFTSSFALIILASVSSVFFGVFWPLAALAQWGRFMTSPAPILGGIVWSIVLVGAYFADELFHYQIVFRWDVTGWKREWGIVASGILCAALLAFVTCCALKIKSR
jgi:hypothetical protein